jgi:hypothetical protein
MSDVLVFFPYDGSGNMSDWLEGLGLDPPAELGRVPNRALLESILREADWPYRAHEREGLWAADFESRDERWPPIQQLTLNEGSVGLRLGPLYGPYLVTREVARECGPQIAVTGSNGASCVVGPETTYEEFHEAVLGCAPPEGGSDRHWSQPPTEEWKHAHAAPEEWPSTPEGWLDYALSGRRGHAIAASEVGVVLQRFRTRPQGGGQPYDVLDETRYAALVARLVEYIRSTPTPEPALVLALGRIPEAQADLEALVQRLEGVQGAEEARRMALLLLRRNE